MKTKREYLRDLEFSEEDINKELVLKEIKSQYYKLTLKYNEDNGTEKNSEKHRIIIEAYESIKDGKFKDEEVVLNNLTPEDLANTVNKALFDFLEKIAIVIELKNNDFKLILIDNILINFDCSKVTKTKFVLINKCRVFKFVRSQS